MCSRCRAAAFTAPTDPALRQLLDKVERHPLIMLRAGAAGGQRPALAGSRLYVWQVLDTLSAGGGSVRDAADYLGLSEQHVQAAVVYYRDHKDEVDRYRAQDREVEPGDGERPPEP